MDAAIVAGGRDARAVGGKGDGEGRAFVALETGEALAVRRFEKAHFAGRAGRADQVAIGTPGQPMHGAGHSLALADEAVFLVVAFGQPPAARLHFVDADAAFVVAENDEVFTRMPREALHAVARAVHVVDEVAAGDVDELDRAVAAGADEVRAVVAEGGAENPVNVVVALHHLAAVGDGEDAHELVRATDGDAGAIGRKRHAEDGVIARADRAKEFLRDHVPELDLAILRSRAARGGEQLAIGRKGERGDAGGIADEPPDDALAIRAVEEHFMVA